MRRSAEAKYNKKLYECRRGLVHLNCNTALGLFRDDPLIVVSAARYLLLHEAKVQEAVQ